MSDLSFKQFHQFVSLEAEPSDEQITEIFGIFQNNKKLDDLKAKRAALTAKQKEDAKKKDALLAQKAAQLRGGDTSKFDKEQGSLTMRSDSARGRAAERDWVASLAKEGMDKDVAPGTMAEYGDVLKKHGFKKQAGGSFHKAQGLGTIKLTKHGHWEHLGVGDTDADSDYEGTTHRTLDRHLTSLLQRESVELSAEEIITEGVQDMLDGSFSAEEIIEELFEACGDEERAALRSLSYSKAIGLIESLLEEVDPPKGVEARVKVAMSGGDKKSLTTAYQNWFGKFGEKNMDWQKCVSMFCDKALPDGFDKDQAKAYLQQVHQGE